MSRDGVTDEFHSNACILSNVFKLDIMNVDRFTAFSFVVTDGILNIHLGLFTVTKTCGLFGLPPMDVNLEACVKMIRMIGKSIYDLLKERNVQYF